MMSEAEKEQIETRLTELTGFIIECTEKVTAGEMVDLSGLDDEIAALCERTVALPPELAQSVQPTMAEMIAQLETLGQALKAFQDNQNSSE